jgi:phospholipid/cholesterol/gamma-HCH transport system substrate-binding protein
MLRTAIKFGAFVAVCLTFTVWLAFTIGNVQLDDLNPAAPDDLQLAAAFDDATGLLVNDPVKIAGVTVGKVTGIRVEQGQALVRFDVDDDHEDLPADTRASVRWRNLIGQRFLYLEPGTAATPIEDGSTITDTDSVADLGALFNSLGPIVGAIDESQVNEFLETITAALDGNADRLGQALDDLATVSSGLASRDAAISSLIEDLNVVAGTITERDQQIRTLLDNLVVLAGEFSANTEIVDEALVEFGSFSTSLAELVRTNRDELDRIIAGLDTTVAETVMPRLALVQEALDGLDEMARSVFLAGSQGEWLNQTILCAGVAPPPCATPLVTGLDTGGIAGASAGRGAPSFADGVDVIAGLLGGSGSGPR